MSTFSEFRTAARKAVSRLRLALGFLPTIPPERIELATRIKEIEPQPTPLLDAVAPRPGYPFALSPEQQRALSTAPLSEGPPVRELKAPFVLSNLTHAEYASRISAVRTLENMGYTWNGGELWKPPLGKPPAYITGEPAPGVADNLRDAIAFALDPHNPDALEWLRSWDEGDPGAMVELEDWRKRKLAAKAWGMGP